MCDVNVIQLSRVQAEIDLASRTFFVTLFVPVTPDANEKASLAGLVDLVGLTGGSILIDEHRYALVCEHRNLAHSDDKTTLDTAQAVGSAVEPAAKPRVESEHKDSDSCPIEYQQFSFALPMQDVESLIGEYALRLELCNDAGGGEVYEFSYLRKKRAKLRLNGLANQDMRAILIASKDGFNLYVDYKEDILERRSLATGKRRKSFYPIVDSFAFSFPHYTINHNEGYFELSSKLYVHTAWNISLDELAISICERLYQPIIRAKYPLSERRYKHECNLVLRIPFADEFSMGIHNALKAVVVISDENRISKGIKYSKYLKKYIAARSPFHKNEEEGIVSFFRQNIAKNITFTVRHANVTDKFWPNAKLSLAWALSKLCFWIKPTLVFEKNGMHYEESGRAVFENLIDSGRKDTYFVLAKAAQDALTKLDNRYKSKMIVQHSFRHYLYFFRCKRFLGSESLAHCLELRCANILVQRKIKAKNQKYVFLQHGVMYMVSLNSPQRSSFRKRNMKGESYIVVSSKKEAAHFIEYGDFTDNDLIVCGIPKFDFSYMSPGADKILIMPTWRIWEFNQARFDFFSTKYFKMIERIYEAIPDALKDKVIIANHPLFTTATFSADGTLKASSAEAPANDILAHYAPEGVSYDELLRDVSLLITDYSSIAYDAYYRGANVIFYWEEKDECMEAYGGETHLMIDEDTAFGPVCYSSEDVPSAALELYGQVQSDLYLGRYREIVEHHDGKNTERLIAMLTERGFFKDA